MTQGRPFCRPSLCPDALGALGVWLVMNGVLGAIGMSNALGNRPSTFSSQMVEFSSTTSGVVGSAFLIAVGTSFLGTVMVLLAPGFVGWLKNKDARAVSSRQTTPASPASEPR